MRRGLRGVVVFVLAAAIAVAPLPFENRSASAHHTPCYQETRNPSPHGSFDKYATTSKAVKFYVPVEGGGLRGTRVFFSPHIHGHGHSCLAWEANVGAHMAAQPNGEWLYVNVQYYNQRTGRWVTAGHTWFSNQYRTQVNRWRLDQSSPRDFTHGRAQAWYWRNNTWSNSQTVTCALGSHGQTRYNCW